MKKVCKVDSDYKFYLQDYWQLNAPIQEIDANVAHVFADPMYKNTQLFKYTTDERLFAKEFRRQPFYLHVPLVYKSVYINLHQSCHVYLTFSEAPSASPAKTVCLRVFLNMYQTIFVWNETL